MFFKRDLLSGFDKFILSFIRSYQKTCLKMKAYDFSILALEMQSSPRIDSEKAIQTIIQGGQKVHQQSGT